MKRLLSLSISAGIAAVAMASVVQVGSGSYSDAFPGTDSAGRNGYISTSPYVSGNAANKPIGTNEWWSNELLNAHANSIFNYPLGLRPEDSGLVIINNKQHEAIVDVTPFKVSVDGVSASSTTVSDYTDWTVTVNWGGTTGMEAIIGQGMPFVYFTKTASGNVRIDVQQGSVTVNGNIAYVSGSYNNGCYACYAPSGSSWTLNGTVLTSDLGGKNYWSVAMLPAGSDAAAGASAYAPYAFVFPKDTRANYTYNASAGTVTTTYVVTPDVKEGSNTNVLMGLLPHHWGNLTSTPNYLSDYTYSTVRGELRMAEGNQFTTSLKYQGILPYLPTATGSTAFSLDELKSLVSSINSNHGLTDWTDSYNDGQLLNRLVQTAESAKASGDEDGFNTAYELVKNRLERWFTYTQGDVAFMFYYHQPWTTLIGYPGGYGSDTNINDHHFHYGYFLRAAAFVAQYDHTWADKWGGMVNLMVRDIASADHDDTMFPYLRSFSTFSGHCWADGTGADGRGTNQESTSESMNFNQALILWGDVTGNQSLRDLGVYLYTTERSAIEEYWFDVHDRNLTTLSDSEALACRVYCNSYDSGNFWGGGIAGSYGIQIYPVQGGSFYLMNNADYAAKLWNAMSTQTGILSNEANDNIWSDAWIRFLSMQDSEAAINLYNNCTRLGYKFGETQAMTYQWIYSMQQLGTPNMEMTASHPLAMAFDKNGVTTYVARNNSASSLVVTYSDGHSMTVSPYSMLVEKSSDEIVEVEDPQVSLAASTLTVQINQSVVLTAAVSIPAGVTVSKVEFIAEDEVIGTATAAPYQYTWTPTTEGLYTVVARAYATTGKTYDSAGLEINVTSSGETPTLNDGCTTVDDECTDGAGFAGQYTVTCKTSGNSVVVTASFAGEYSGFDGPWLWDQTSGFAEYGMTNNGDGTYSYTFENVTTGSTLKMRIKVAFTGGMAVTKYIEYTVGTNCGATSVVNVLSDEAVKVYPNPTERVWNVSFPYEEATIRIWNLTGALMGVYNVSDGSAMVDATNYPSGRYIMQIVSESGEVRSAKLLKR